MSWLTDSMEELGAAHCLAVETLRLAYSMFAERSAPAR